MARFCAHLACWLIASACAAIAPPELIESRPLPTRAATPGPLFEPILPAQSGIDLVHEFPPNAPLVLMQEQGSGAGLAAGDFDGDGLPDLFVTNYDRGCRLYRNLGGWRFADVTGSAGVRAAGRWCTGVTFVDVDGDGDLDIYVCCYNAPNLLFINQGNGLFVERAREFGLDWTGASIMAAFADYDLDGRLDVFLLTHRDGARAEQRLPANTRNAADRGILRRDAAGRLEVAAPFRDLFSLLDKGGGRMELAIAGQPDLLFHQEANGVFHNVTERSGIRGNDIGLGVSWWDYNGDGRPDIYVANDHKTPDRLWRNNGDGTFTDVAPSVLPCVPLASMGTDTADIDNDGWIDLLSTEMAGSTYARRMVTHQDPARSDGFLASAQPRQLPRNTLFLGTGGEHVLEAAHLAGVEATDWTWSPKFGDFDNDGWVDLFVANGASHDYVHEDLLARMAQPGAPGWRIQPLLRETHLAFRNRGDRRFERVESAWGLDRVSASFATCLADFDGDGTLDIALMNLGEPLGLYRNRESLAHRIVLRLVGSHANSWGIGAVVQAETSHGLQTRCLQLASGFQSVNEPLVHFGLGPDARVARLTVRWPGGAEQSFSNLAADRFYTVHEPFSPAAPTGTPVVPVHALFRAAEVGAGLVHRERPFDDFAREPLLPWKLSQLGPGLAVGDIDGDGDDDIYLGGGAGQPGMIGVQEAGGHFRTVVLPAFENDRESEDMGALFLDADGDGDLDLYVVSGGAGFEPDSPALQDRLYLNDGHGHFTPAPAGSLPEDRDAGSVVCAADLDRDGDLDLFVGGRLVPGSYLVQPRSRLLVNQGGRFVDATASRAPDLADAGMVTSAIWIDVDNDGWPDLVTASEWGTLKLFMNRGGRLERRDEGSEFLTHPGLWQGLAAADIDGDGDFDLLASNLGLNTSYRAAPDRPAAIARIEADPGAPPLLLQAFLDHDAWRPWRRRESLATGLPSLTARFPTFESFSHATIPELIPGVLWTRQTRSEINTLECGVWLNDGQGHFTFRPLPRLAQVAPGFGVVAADLDGDGVPDLATAGNFRSPAPEFGPFSGGLGLLLRGRKGAGFDPLPPNVSGFALPSDHRALALIDLDGDNAPDLLAARNDGALVALHNQRRPDVHWMSLRLQGPKGNPTGVGARVEVAFGPGAPQVNEVRAGGGYLSQSSATLYFGIPAPDRGGVVKVRWPDGTSSSKPIPAGTRSMTVDSR